MTWRETLLAGVGFGPAFNALDLLGRTGVAWSVPIAAVGVIFLGALLEESRLTGNAPMPLAQRW